MPDTVQEKQPQLLWGIKGPAGADLSREFGERLKAFFDKLLEQRPLAPTVEVKAIDKNGVKVNVTIPISLLPEDYYYLVHEYLIISPAKGKMGQTLEKIPEEHRERFLYRARQTMRGRYVHSHKGRRLRHHRIMRPLWLIDLGRQYKLRPFPPEYRYEEADAVPASAGSADLLG